MAGHVCSWHETDMPTRLRDVRSQGQSGKHMLAWSFSDFDPNRTFDLVSDAIAPIKLLSAKGRLVASPCASVCFDRHFRATGLSSTVPPRMVERFPRFSCF